MATILKVSKAFRAMKDIGIGEDRTEPVLKKLLKLYDKNWELIEEENYRVLADAIFHEGDIKEEDFREDIQVPNESVRPLKRLRLRGQEAQVSPFQNSTASYETPLIINLEEDGFPAETHPPQQLQLYAPKRSENDPSSSPSADKGKEEDFGEDIQVLDESVCPLKRLCVRGQEAQVSPFQNSTVSGLDETPLIINLEEDGFPETHPLKQLQLCAPKRSENEPSSSRRAGKGKPVSPNMVARVKKSNMEKPFTALLIKEPAVVLDVKNHKVRASGAHTLIVPKDEPFTDDISTTVSPPYELPIADIHTGLLPKDEPFTDDISTTVSPPYELPIAAIHTGSLPKDEPFTDDISTTISPPYELPIAAIHTGSLPKDEPFTDDISTTVSPSYELPIVAIHTGSLPKDEPFTNDISTTILPPYELSIAAIHPDPSSKGDCVVGNNSVGKPDSEDARASHPLDGSKKVDSTGITQYKRSTGSKHATVIEESHPNSPLEEVVISYLDQRSTMSGSNGNENGLNDKGKRPMDMTRSIGPGNRKTPARRSGVVITEALSDSPMSPPSSTSSSRHMSASTSHEEDTLMPSSNCDNIATSESSNKPRTRGWAKNNALRKKKSTDKKNIMIMPTIKRVVGTDTKNFATEVGILVRQLIPPSHLTYEQVPPHILDHIRVRIADEFHFDLTNQEHWKVVDDQMKSSAKQFRYELGRAYHRNVLKFGDEARHMKLPRVERDEDWELLIKKWESKEFKNLSQQNIASRKHLPYLHKGGSKSNANKFHEMRQEKPDTTWVDVFETQHSYQKDVWVSNLAKEQHQQMVQYMSPPETEDGSDTVESRQPLNDIDAMQKTLGDRSGYRRGMGRGPKPPPKSSASSRSFEPSQNELLTQEKLKEALQSIESLKERELQREEEHKKLQEDMAVLMRFFKSQGGGGGG